MTVDWWSSIGSLCQSLECGLTARALALQWNFILASYFPFNLNCMVCLHTHKYRRCHQSWLMFNHHFLTVYITLMAATRMNLPDYFKGTSSFFLCRSKSFHIEMGALDSIAVYSVLRALGFNTHKLEDLCRASMWSTQRDAFRTNLPTFASQQIIQYWNLSATTRLPPKDLFGKFCEQ